MKVGDKVRTGKIASFMGDKKDEVGIITRIGEGYQFLNIEVTWSSGIALHYSKRHLKLAI